jgi:hypothetical protein
MIYALDHETSYLCASRKLRRARSPAGGIASSTDAFMLRRCQILLASSRGENAYQIVRRASGATPRRPRATPSTSSTSRGFQRRLSKAPSVRIPFTELSIPSRGPARTLAQLSKGVWQTDESVDFGYGRRGQLRGRPHKRAHYGRDHPGHLGADGNPLGASQTCRVRTRDLVQRQNRVEAEAPLRLPSTASIKVGGPVRVAVLLEET